MDPGTCLTCWQAFPTLFDSRMVQASAHTCPGPFRCGLRNYDRLRPTPFLGKEDHLFGLDGNLNLVLRSHSRPAVVVPATRHVLLRNPISTPLNLVDLCAAVDISTDGKVLTFTLYGRHNSCRIPSLNPLYDKHRFAQPDI